MGGLSRTSVLLSNFHSADELISLADVVVECGYSRVWLAETGGLDAAGMGAVLARTTRLEIGTSIVPVYSRTPALLAMMASTISQLGDGRVVHLGIGAGGQTIVENWHGEPFSKPVATTRETIEILRQALAGDRTSVEGAMRRSLGFRLLNGPASEVRIAIGGMGPAMVDLAAEVADALIVTWLSPRVLAGFRASFSKAIQDHGRDPNEVRLAARVYVGVTPTPEEAREEVRKELVEYLVSPPYGRYFSSVGFEDEVTRVTAAFQARDRAGAVQAVTDRVVDEVLVLGRDASEIEVKLRAYLTEGADEIIIQPVPTSRGGDPERTIRAVAEALG